MQNCGTTLNINQKPVLPFTSQPSLRKLKEISSLPIGTKVKSFQIKKAGFSTPIKPENAGAMVKLPNFSSAEPFLLDIFANRVIAKSLSFYAHNHAYPEKTILKANKVTSSAQRFWWNCLLFIGSLVLLFPWLLQTSSQARNLLERAKIYIELDSQQAVTMPNSGRYYLQRNQASLFNKAIAQARTIEPNSPFYEDAKADILRWSEVILDIAQGRASQGDFAGAIAAAELVPQDLNSVGLIAQQARKSIEYWQLRANQQSIDRTSLKKAKNMINPDQASSYSRAIGILRQVSPGGAEYQEAQTLIRQWSKQIYMIANYRASRGAFTRAIQAAELVPKDSPYYQGAKNAMIHWKKFLPANHSW